MIITVKAAKEEITEEITEVVMTEEMIVEVTRDVTTMVVTDVEVTKTRDAIEVEVAATITRADVDKEAANPTAD